jgi:hypothetical protein
MMQLGLLDVVSIGAVLSFPNIQPAHAYDLTFIEHLRHRGARRFQEPIFGHLHRFRRG